jgi:hypothetical protein
MTISSACPGGQLVGDRDLSTGEQTPTQSQSRFGIVGTDLGYPFEHRGEIWFLFGVQSAQTSTPSRRRATVVNARFLLPSMRALGVLALGLTLATPAPGELIAGDIDTDDVSRIDPQTAGATLVGNLGENLSFGGFALDTSTGTLYVSDLSVPAGGYGLGTVDLATGAATIIGGHVNSNNIWGLAYDSANDVLYGADGSNVGLAVLDRATGVSNLVGGYGASVEICGLAYDAASDTLYGVDSDGGAGTAAVIGNGAAPRSPEGVAVPSTLYTIDRATGAVTEVGPLGVDLDPEDVRCGLAIDAVAGTLYAGAYDGTLYTVDKATGAATLVGDSGIAYDALESLFSRVTWVDIPALSAGGLALLVAVLALGGIWLLRRRVA